MNRIQLEAREAIAIYEGNRLDWWMDGYTLVCVVDTGGTYRVDPEAKHIVRSDGRTFDLCMLETAIEDPMWFGTSDPEPIDDSLYEDIFAREAARPVTDYHEDRWADLRADAERIDHDRRYYAEREAA